jgi:hypothetical protein
MHAYDSAHDYMYVRFAAPPTPLPDAESDIINQFELGRRTQRLSLTFCLLGRHLFGLCPVLLLRDGG